MTSQDIERSDYYVYALFREDGQTPFYIGKGRGYRLSVHERMASRGNTIKDRTIRKMMLNGHRPIAVKLIDRLADDMAKQIEIDLILLIGRRPKGPLANLTRGGDGVSELPPESKARQLAANKNSWNDTEKRRRRLESMRATWTPEKRKEHGDKMKCRPPEVYAKARAALRAYYDARPKKSKPVREPGPRDQRAIMKRFWSDPVKRSKMIETRRNNPRALTEDQKRQMADRLNNPQSIAKRAVTSSLPEVREKRIAAQRAAFSSPEAKAKRSKVSKEMWSRKKAQKDAPLGSANESHPQA